MKRAAVNRPLKLFYITLAEMAGYKKARALRRERDSQGAKDRHKMIAKATNCPFRFLLKILNFQTAPGPYRMRQKKTGKPVQSSKKYLSAFC